MSLGWLSVPFSWAEGVVRQWKFDPLSAIVTILVSPLLFFLLRIVLKESKELGRYAVEGGMYWASRFIRHSLAGALTLRRYCRLQLAGQNRYLYVPSRSDVKVEIDEVFVTLTLEEQSGQKRKYTHSDLWTLGNRIRIIGDPGSGKSSLIKRLFRDSCERAVQKASESRLPILFELKNLEVPPEILPDTLDEFLYKLLRSNASKTEVYRMADCFDNYAQTAGLLVLLDGLDEVSTTAYPRVHAAIEGLSRRLEQAGERNVVIVTMRAQFHQQVREKYRDSFGQALFLRPFTPSDIYEFLAKWPFAKDIQRNVARIFKDLTDRPTLREMCSNPLVLSMYVAEDQAAGYATTPDSRTEFYAKVTEELLLRRRLKQTGPASAPAKLREQRERILGRLAYEHLLNPDQPTNLLEWSEAIRVIREIMKCSKAEAEVAFDELGKETGLVTEERRRQTLRFIHLTFCEFLAAYEAVQGQKDGWSRLLDAHRGFLQSGQAQLSTRLLEVIPFAAGLLPRIKRDDALSDLENLGDRRLAARSFLETKLYEHTSWPILVATERQALLNTPEEKWDERWLRDLYLFNVVVRDANQCALHVPVAGGQVDLAEFFHELVERQSDSLATLLSAYATQDAAAAMRLAEVCHLDLAADFPEIVISCCDQAPFMALVQEQALREPTRTGLWASLFAEAALRSRIVAAWMWDREPEEAWLKYVYEVPRRNRWFAPAVVRASLYTECLTIAVGAQGRLGPIFQMLGLVRRMPAPGSFRWLNIAAVSGTILIALGSLLGWLSWLFAFRGFSTLSGSWAAKMLFLGIPAGVATAWYIVILRMLALKFTYRWILGQTMARNPREVRLFVSLGFRAQIDNPLMLWANLVPRRMRSTLRQIAERRDIGSALEHGDVH